MELDRLEAKRGLASNPIGHLESDSFVDISERQREDNVLGERRDFSAWAADVVEAVEARRERQASEPAERSGRLLTERWRRRKLTFFQGFSSG